MVAERRRAEKRLGSSLQAHPTVHVEDAELRGLLEGLDLADIAITSDLTLAEGAPPEGAFKLEEVPGVAAVVALAAGEKCQRCWKVLPEVGSHGEAPETCGRCADALGRLGWAPDGG